ncbi:MAG: polysaccharide deacetylase family protein [Candidatus Poribacteria bacterium]|nr:polysaccharide deacetylase family protein [Candidatus Poribacteria bacterium]
MQFLWNDDTRAAISLTFDDGMASHLDTAIPLLEKYGLRGTFYITARGEDGGQQALTRFRPAFEAGHEIGNHSIHHWCSCAGAMDAQQRGLEYRTLDEVEAELRAADERFKAVFPEVERWSFCYPCYNTFVGKGLNRRSYVPIVAKFFFAARAGGEMSNLINSPYHADVHCLSSWKCERRSAAELIGLVEQTATQGGWSIFTFHGFGEGHLPVAQPDFEALLVHLDAVRDRIQTAPLVKVAEYLHSKRPEK